VPEPASPARSADRGMDEAPDPRRWKALAVCLVTGFMTLLDVSIVNVALPSIRTGVGATEADLQWVVSGYALAFGLFLIPAGRLGDARGRRKVFVAGVVLFTVSSLAAGLAPTAEVLVVSRLVQGVGGGLLSPQVSALIQDLFRGAERARAFGMFGTTVGISTAVGPLLGGLIIGGLGVEDGWRWIFFVNLPVGVAAVLLALRWIPADSADARRRESLDPVGVLLLGAAVLALLLPLVEGRQGGAATGWWLLPVGLALVGAFVLWEKRHAARGHAPLVDLALFAVRGYSPGAVVGAVYFAGFTAVFFVLTIFFQEGLGYSALMSGLATTPFAAGGAITASIGGRLVTRYGRAVVTGGLGVVVVGLLGVDLVLSLVEGPAAGWALALPLLVAGAGSGFVISPNITLTLADVPVERAGTAGGVLQTGQRMGTATGIALVGAVFFMTAAGGDLQHAAAVALRVTLVTVLVALAASVVDLVRRRRAAASGRDG
jgi:EmrB/QacA subfamily drug resistance transporter